LCQCTQDNEEDDVAENARNANLHRKGQGVEENEKETKKPMMDKDVECVEGKER